MQICFQPYSILACFEPNGFFGLLWTPFSKIPGKYGRGIRMLYDKGRYLECLDLIEDYDVHTTDANEKSTAAILKKNAAKKACEEFYENSQYEDLQRALKYLTHEDQFNFLKERKDCIRLLIQVYKDYNKVDLLIAYYLDMLMFSEVAELEVNIKIKISYLNGCSANVR